MFNEKLNNYYLLTFQMLYIKTTIFEIYYLSFLTVHNNHNAITYFVINKFPSETDHFVVRNDLIVYKVFGH